MGIWRWVLGWMEEIRCLCFGLLVNVILVICFWGKVKVWVGWGGGMVWWVMILLCCCCFRVFRIGKLCKFYFYYILFEGWYVDLIILYGLKYGIFYFIFLVLGIKGCLSWWFFFLVIFIGLRMGVINVLVDDMG